MKKVVQALIVVAAIITVIAIISQFSGALVVGIKLRALAVLAGLLLLFAIALK
mgnify:CR=1 FL=1